ncbi:MAG: EcsC family protein [Lachnospiraceae bacterium]|nr:EcsC family protein [Lachnospiraceae bacterium]
MVFKKESSKEKELRLVYKEEEKLRKIAQNKEEVVWKKELESKIPPKVYEGLNSAFCKAFYLIFEKGTGIIEKTYNKEEIKQDHMVRDYAIQLKGTRKELRKLDKQAKSSDVRNILLTTAEGIGLGALGVGLPDIVLFVGMMMKGIYECAAHYGIDYENPAERLLILNMMSASMSTKENWEMYNKEVDSLIANETLEKLYVSEEELKVQIEKTAEIFAMDMLLLKFVQGLPIVGILGGASNPIYYRKVMRYVQVKYKKRYLLNLNEI